MLRLRLDEERKTNRLQKTAIEQLEQRIKKIDSQHAKTEKEKEEYQDALAEKLCVSLATQEARLNKIIQGIKQQRLIGRILTISFDRAY